MVSVAVAGNCQANGIASALATLTGATVRPFRLGGFKTGKIKAADVASEADVVICLRGMHGRFAGVCEPIFYPAMTFGGYHPDDVQHVTSGGQEVSSPMGHNHSAIALWAFLNGLSPSQTERLFTGEVFEHLGYFSNWNASKSFLLREAQECGLTMGDAFDEWARQGPFMFVPAHPKAFVLGDLARLLATKAGIPVINRDPEFDDTLMRKGIWPVYPDIAKRLGLEGGYTFELGSKFSGDLPAFIEGSFERYRAVQGTFDCARLADVRYDGLRRFLPTPRRRSQSNPYKEIPDYCFWKKSVANRRPEDIDPVVSPRFQIAPDTKVATAGSCFAQHISRSLRTSGYTYLATEDMPDKATFSARYGNIYTARQLLQLWQRAYGQLKPVDTAWPANSRFRDPFRPEIEPEGFASIEELVDSRERHLAAVREMFETLDVFVFTLGLTEAWRSRKDGSVFPLAPGVVTSEINKLDYEFVNFDIQEVQEDLFTFLDCFSTCMRRDAKVLLTVSPVPLIATYENRHALVSTTYSKAVLRVAVDACLRRYPWVDYLPSYEIITGPASRGAYFEDDLRSIAPEGVAHVMGVFFRHYTAREAQAYSFQKELVANSQVICDEERLED